MAGMPTRTMVCVRRVSRRGAIRLAHDQRRWRAGDNEREQEGEDTPQHLIHYSVISVGSLVSVRSVVRCERRSGSAGL